MLNLFGRHRHLRRLLRLVQPYESDPARRAQRINLLLERERARSDRSGRPLSMVLIGVAGRSAGRSPAERIVAAMRERCRTTDEVGWFDRLTGFAILPDTSAAGARRFAGSVRDRLANKGIQTSHAVYQYRPSGSKNDDDAPPGGRRRPTVRRHGRRALAEARRQPVASTPSRQPVATHALQPIMTIGLPWWKRSLDVAASGSALLVLWPVLVTIGLAIRLDSPGSAIFRQQRAGLGGRPFSILKFRTMVADAESRRAALEAISEQDGPAFKIKDDPRVTRMGHLLRRTSLDELPQLVNILRGDMTLVGPRPLPVHESDACLPWQKRRLDVTPGLTCIWQVWGRSTVGFDDWCRMDLNYLGRRTPQRDLKILLATVPAVIKQRGAC